MPSRDFNFWRFDNLFGKVPIIENSTAFKRHHDVFAADVAVKNSTQLIGILMS
jgi:hypothetical protein